MALSRKIMAGIFMAGAGVNIIGTASASAFFGSKKRRALLLRQKIYIKIG